VRMCECEYYIHISSTHILSRIFSVSNQIRSRCHTNKQQNLFSFFLFARAAKSFYTFLWQKYNLSLNKIKVWVWVRDGYNTHTHTSFPVMKNCQFSGKTFKKLERGRLSLRPLPLVPSLVTPYHHQLFERQHLMSNRGSSHHGTAPRNCGSFCL
jgi:hypothetical protein